MRKSTIEKAATHRRIVALAAKRFRERGIHGIGVADLMKEAGTSAGGFYKHFTSREDLVVEALEEAFHDLDRLEERSEDLAALFASYVSERHSAHPEKGCALTALAGDMRQANDAARNVYTNRVEKTLAHYSDGLPPGDENSRRARAVFLLAAALGSVTLSRAVNDKKLSREILTAARQHLIAMSSEGLPPVPPVASTSTSRQEKSPRSRSSH